MKEGRESEGAAGQDGEGHKSPRASNVEEMAGVINSALRLARIAVRSGAAWDLDYEAMWHSRAPYAPTQSTIRPADKVLEFLRPDASHTIYAICTPDPRHVNHSPAGAVRDAVPNSILGS